MEKPSKYAYINRKMARRNMEQEYVPERDLNIFTVTFQKAKESEKNIGAGDPFLCVGCKVCLNKFSKILNKTQYDSIHLIKKELSKIQQEVEQNIVEQKKEKSETKILNLSNSDFAWVCQFCNVHNKIRIEKEQIPTIDDMVYIIESASQKADKEATQDQPTMVFCVDNSGSMNITSQVKGKINIKYGISQQQIEMLKQFMEEGDMAQMINYFPGQNLGNTHVSRKQCVMAAIQNQLIEIKKNQGNKKVGLVTFNNEVVVFGDCQKDPVLIVGDKLSKTEQITQSLIQTKISAPLKFSYDKIINNFNKIQASGATALGPAIQASIELASKGKPGSSVFICTDGLANIGLGALDVISQESIKYYQDLANKAKQNHIIVNILTIKGQGCKIEYIGKLANLTNGNIEIVNPEDIGKNFANILKDEVIGIKVNIVIRLHKSMKFKNQLKQNLRQDGSILEKNIPNATVNTKISFQYQLKSDQQLKQLGIVPESIKSVPFQAQITYTTLQGHKYMRIITSINEATTNKSLIQKNVEKLDVVHTRIAQQSTAWMNRGEKLDSLVQEQYNQGWMNYLKKNVVANEEQRFENEGFEQKNMQLRKAKKHKQLKKQIQIKKMENKGTEELLLKQQLKNLDVDSDEDEKVMAEFTHGKYFKKK